MKLSGLPYVGSKADSYGNSTGAGKWIASLLPARHAYCEPFAGMAGVLLQRQRSRVEVLNDLDSLVTNWWKVVRDQPDELLYAMEHTPYSEEVYHKALATIDTERDPVQRAVALWIRQCFGIQGAIGTFKVSTKKNDAMSAKFQLRKIKLLSERLAYTTITNRPANRILEQMASERDVVIYCDPPYAFTRDHYRAGLSEEDRAAMSALLLEQQGLVAISGYAGEWDHLLGWCRSELATSVNLSITRSKKEPRTEVLWTNFEPAEQMQLL